MVAGAATGQARLIRRPGIGRRGRRSVRLAQNRALAHIVASKLQLQWAPRQIAGWLKRSYPDDETYQVSHETIYRTLFNTRPVGP